MAKSTKWILGFIIAGIYVGCAPVKFQQNLDCDGYTTCVGINGNRDISLVTKMPSGVVDVLFVDDNSASMSTEQAQIASRFSSFISALDSKQVDYRIGIITTDVQSDSNGPNVPNQNGALQNGNLIQFENGSFYLTPGAGTTANTSMFAKAIKRDETTICETFLKNNPNINQQSPTYAANCPSGDERGIYAANLFVQHNPLSFVRPFANLAIVFLTDEDVRSSLYNQANWNSNYLLSELDLPQTLIRNVSTIYKGKAVSMHAISIRAGTLKNGLTAAAAADQIAAAFMPGGSMSQASSPVNLFNAGDTTCLNTQNSQINNVNGSYGYLYTLGARMTGGVEGNICATDYSSQLSGIAQNVQRNEITLSCSAPQMERVNSWDPNTQTEGNAIAYTLEGSTLKFDNTLPSTTWVYIKFICPGLVD